MTCKVSAESGMKQKIKNTKERDVERETDPDVKKSVKLVEWANLSRNVIQAKSFPQI